MRRKLGRVTGWLAYTLSRSERRYPCGLRPADFDQTHVLAVLMSWQMGYGWELGGRFRYTTGFPRTPVVNHYNNTTTGLYDLRLSKQIPFGERLKLQLIADGFNLFNRTNVAAVNQLCDPTAGGTCLAGQPTAAYDARQFQFAVKLYW